MQKKYLFFCHHIHHLRLPHSWRLCDHKNLCIGQLKLIFCLFLGWVICLDPLEKILFGIFFWSWSDKLEIRKSCLAGSPVLLMWSPRCHPVKVLNGLKAIGVVLDNPEKFQQHMKKAYKMSQVDTGKIYNHTSYDPANTVEKKIRYMLSFDDRMV